MNAIRVATTKGHGWHWLLDEGRTYCGLHVDRLNVVERDERDTLPPVEGCRGCIRCADGWTPRPHERADERVTLAPSLGRLRTTGPLAHGTRTRSGRRLA